MTFILSLAVILLFTKCGGHLSVRLGQPAVLGKLIVGILLGPAILGWIQNDSVIHIFSEIGVLLLMFIAGLETDLKLLKKNWKSSIAVAVGGVILPFIGSYTVAFSFGLSQTYALFFGILFCATSVSISVQVLKEMNQLNSSEGSTILGAAVADDVLVIILLAMMMSILGTGTDVSMGLLIGKQALFFVFAAVAGWFLVPKILQWLAPLRVSEAIVSAALIICLGFSYFADYMGMASILGAFAAGIAISRTSFKSQVESRVEPIAYAVFVPVFFVSIGLSVTFEGLGGQLGLVIVCTVMAIATKLLGGWLGARMTGFRSRSALAIGAGMVSRGEVALIIAATGLQEGLLLPQYFTAVIITVIATTLVTPPLLKIVFPKSNI